MMDKYKFRRNLYVNDPDPIITATVSDRATHTWAFAIDGQAVTEIDQNGQWWVGPYKVQRDWCEKVPPLHVIDGLK